MVSCVPRFLFLKLDISVKCSLQTENSDMTHIYCVTYCVMSQKWNSVLRCTIKIFVEVQIQVEKKSQYYHTKSKDGLKFTDGLVVVQSKAIDYLVLFVTATWLNLCEESWRYKLKIVCYIVMVSIFDTEHNSFVRLQPVHTARNECFFVTIFTFFFVRRT